MFTTLLAVIAALVLGHLAPSLVAGVRDWRWFGHWLAWVQEKSGGADSRHGLWLAVLPCVLLAALLHWVLSGGLFGLPGLCFAIAIFVVCWGPGDLDRDVEAVIDADDPMAVTAAHLQRAGGGLESGVSRADGVALLALRRWFAPLLWFLLLGPSGAVLYRLLEQALHGGARGVLADVAHAGGQRALKVLEWPVAQLMTLAMALAGNFDTVLGAWRRAGGNRASLSSRFLGEAARASVGVQRGDGGHLEGLLLADELRDAMDLVWRMLLLWLAVLALLVITGWVG